MKNNKLTKHIYILLSVLLSVSFCISCSDDNDKKETNVNLIPNPKFDAKIYFASKLNDAPIATNASEYMPLGNFFKQANRDKLWLGIIDRADVTYSVADMFNGSVGTASQADLFSTFAFNRFNGNTHEGSMLLFPGYIKNQQSIKITDDCYIRAIDLALKGYNSEIERDVNFDVVFRTVRFSTNDQIKVFSESVFKEMKAGRLNMLMIGTVKKDLVEALKTGVASVDDDFKVAIAEGTESSDYNLFLLAYEYIWALKGTTKQTLGNIDMYELSLMW
ncbi:MAG: hypothetical protein LBH58_08930 [Tannerellaceae bacterium]|jgi:hypothetical protein|nr:hypothetical protein [Tannerellaceae bacterium]